MSRGYTQGKVVICPKCGKECRKGFASAQHAAKHDREAQAPSTASLRIEKEFAAFANQIAEVERNDFFDSRNRKTWMREFGLYLQRKAEGAVEPREVR